MREKLQRMSWVLFALVSMVWLEGCCSKNKDGSETCDYTAQCNNDVSGYVLFANGTSQTGGADVVLQWSDDSFATHTYVGTTVNNLQGMIVVPFKFTVNYACGTVPSIQLRAFESIDRTDTWKSGDIEGRDDGTSTGNAAYTTRLASSATQLTINLDGNGAQ